MLLLLFDFYLRSYEKTLEMRLNVFMLTDPRALLLAIHELTCQSTSQLNDLNDTVTTMFQNFQSRTLGTIFYFIDVMSEYQSPLSFKKLDFFVFYFSVPNFLLALPNSIRIYTAELTQ